MIRNLKSLGLALVAVLAMSAVVASAAQAVPSFTASAYPATATGSNSKGSETFTLDHSTVQCDSHFVTNSLAAASSTLTVTPTYSNCEAFGFSATVNPEGCTYVFHATEQVAAGVYNHHVDVVCPTGKSIKITAATCSAEVKAQTGKTTATTTNLGGGSVTVQPNVVVSTTVTNDGFACPLTGTGTRNATYHGDVVVSRVGGGSISVSGS
jgi:hypothetical protein